MTTYTAIANSEVDTDSPITESLMTRLRDNPLAQAEGSAGAPKIASAAFSNNTLAAVKLVNASVTLTTQHSKPNSKSSWSATTGGGFIPAGAYNISVTHPGGGATFIEIFVSGAWRTLISASSTTHVMCQLVSDGTNVRYRTNTGTGTVAYTQMYN